MKYLSVDLETTGLNPERAQILEFGAIYDDGTKPIDECPAFRKVLVWDVYVGEPFALALNRDLLSEIAKGESPDLIPGQQLAEFFMQWLNNIGVSIAKPIVAAGKNFAGFDLGFLKRLPGFQVPDGIKFHHRALDPMGFYVEDSDETPPGMEVCCERAGIALDGFHTAVGDARTVARLIRRGFARRGFKVVGNEELAA